MLPAKYPTQMKLTHVEKASGVNFPKESRTVNNQVKHQAETNFLLDQTLGGNSSAIDFLDMWSVDKTMLSYDQVTIPIGADPNLDTHHDGDPFYDS